MAQRSNVFTKAQVVISSSTDDGLLDSSTMMPIPATSLLESARNVSGSVKSVELSRTFDMLDDTVMGETARSRKAGLEDVTATIEFVQTFAAGGNQVNIDELLSEVADISQSGKSVLVYIRPTSEDQGMNNPGYAFSAVLESHTPMSGAVGEILMTSIPFRSAGGSLERRVTST